MILKAKIRTFFLDHWDVILVFVFALVLLGIYLGKGSLLDWDEAIYAQISREMNATGNWLTPHWQGLPWFEKPPLYLWSTATLFKLFGISELTARLTSALAGAGTLALTFQIGKALRSRVAGGLAAFVLVTSGLFIFQSRFGTVDALLCFFMLLAFYGLLKLRQTGKPGYWFLVCVPAACAVMTKGVGALLILLLVGIACLTDRKMRSTMQSRSFILSLIAGAMIALPWHFYMYLLFHNDFIASYLGYHVVDRVTGLAGQDAHRNQYYIQVLYDRFYPWAYALPIALALVATKLRRNYILRNLAIFCLLVFVIYTVAVTKLDWYILPILPALAIFVGYYFDYLLLGKAEDSESYNLLLYGLVVMSGGLLLSIGSRKTALIYLVVCGGVTIYARYSQQSKLAAAYMMLILFGFLGLKQLRMELRPHAISSVDVIGGEIMDSTNPPPPMLVYQADGNSLYGPAQIFYTNHTPTVVRSSVEVEVILRQGAMQKDSILNLTSQDQERNTRLASGSTQVAASWPILMSTQNYNDLKSVLHVTVIKQDGSLVLGRVSLQ